MKIEEIKIQNFKALQSVEIKNLPSLAVFLGANGSGKTTLFKVFSFLKECLQTNVTAALAKDGGYDEVVSRGQTGPILLEFKFRLTSKSPLMTYSLTIGRISDDGPAVVKREILSGKRGGYGRPWHFLDFANGSGKAIVNETEINKVAGTSERTDNQTLSSPDLLAIKGLGQFERFEAASAFRKLIEGWHVSNFVIDNARPSHDAGYAEHLSEDGSNLALVAQYLHRTHKKLFQTILDRLKERIPGISDVGSLNSQDGRVLLMFRDGAFESPFVAKHVSDGTIKMFAYLVLLNDPKPHPLLAIEEPENQLHPELLEELAEEFLDYAHRRGQVFISTHSPDFINGIELENIFWLSKENGYSKVTRASDDPNLKSLINQGDKPGWLWKEHLFRGSGPR